MTRHLPAVPRRDRALSGAAAAALHLILLLLFLERVPTPQPARDRTLTLFEVPPPAPPPPPSVAVPPPPAPRIATAPGGGRPTRAPTVAEQPRPAPRERPEATLLTAAVAAPPAMLASALDLGAPTVGLGVGTGAGSGNGPGDGAGTGGDVPAPEMLRAAWLRHPTAAEFRTHWPAAALTRKLSGAALLSCTIAPDGVPRDCAVLQERPAHGGFGAAALTLSRSFVIRPVTRGGTPVDMPVRVPVIFNYRTLKAVK